MPRNIFAYTPMVPSTYPPYISLNEVNDTTVLTLRGAGNFGQTVSTMELDDTQLAKLAESIQDYLRTKQAS
jgi:hypothetical protein